MEPGRIAALAFRSAWRERRRTWPAALGIAVGVAALVAMVGVGQGAERAVVERIRAMGSDLVTVSAGQVRVVLGRARQVGNVTTLTAADAEALRAVAAVAQVAPAQGQKLPVQWGDLKSATTVLGAGEAIFAVRNLEVASGRPFDAEEDRAARRVVLVGETVRRSLFGDREPVGELLRINRVPFEVIGTLAPKGVDAVGTDQDDVVVVPLGAALRRLMNVDHLSNVYVQARRGRTGEAAAEIGALLRERHRLKAGKADDFTVQDQAEALAVEASAAQSFTALLAVVSAVALLIGGVGVLAVMLIAVRERVREVGLRRALGATRRDVLLQFGGEAVAIGAVGGAVGIAGGAAAALTASALGGWPIEISLGAAAGAAALSTVVAAGFGAIPARRAAAVDPATSLRGA
ncbi:MAG TPA: ABC transporter permease [Anaeromyxobacteraceae bacterium]|nr:ABC transporter permease [Anaeromyxobacteraceae bacterium]